MDDINVPLWVEKVGRPGGRDHLSLESVGQAILEEITSGVSNITRRARYYSFYCWVIKSFFDSDKNKTGKSYRQHLKRASFLYAMSNSMKHLDSSLTGLDGIDFARNNLDKLINKEKITDDAFFQSTEYRDNNWIYKAKLNNLLLTTENDASGVPALVEPSGKQLAESFDRSLGDTSVDLENFGGWNPDYLNKLEDIWCYHNLKKFEEERKILEDIFFARNTDNNKQLNRRYSFALILQFIDMFGSKNLHDFEKWICSKPELPEKINNMATLWRYLFSRNYLVFSFESFFLYFLLKSSQKQLSLEQVFEELKKDVNSQIDTLLPLNDYIEEPLIRIVDSLKSDVDKNNLFETEMVVSLDLLNRGEYLENTSSFLKIPIFTLIALYNRYKKEDYSQDEETFLGIGEAQRISMLSWIKIVDKAIEENLTLFQFIVNIIQSHVITRHQLVATQKFYSQNLDTFHFNIEEGVVNVKPIAKDFRPKYNVMKLEEIINIFEDLNLVNYEGEKILLTERGKEVLREFYE
ncbi:MAG: hypothetical protein UT08_C0013G0017 [Candidatus Woesebacteria bacterium GW2011_GWB1_38_8]|uniref:Uncharacterized protein n=1 Tax=Candidatus Woesebacteria bacterium GW2011_GWB1_38_8 TaxID=1618570 RepID=A0A0G0LAI9_9BACT|nr:MAG: hypothetical protein UT08_C0013G0017 [Candidatus Woesebacteria bacterium GW2011_GWB1_38_8]